MYLLLSWIRESCNVLGLYDSEELAEEAKKFFPTVDPEEFFIEKREVNKVYAVREGQRMYFCRNWEDGEGSTWIERIDPTFSSLEEKGLVNFSTGECGDLKITGGVAGRRCREVVLWAIDKSEAKRVFMQMLGERG